MLYGADEKLSLKEYLLQKPIWIWIVIVVLIIFGVGIGLFGVYQLVNTNDQEIVTSNDIDNQVCTQTADFGQVTVYISGAVVNPGVYILETGDRIIDLLESAGGFSKSADKVYINRQFNLAKRLSDGDQLYIPTTAETKKQFVTKFEEAGNAILITTNESQGLISINSSTQNKLMELLGVGEVRAGKIIENRPYGSLDELVSKSVISESLFNEIGGFIKL